MSLVLGIFFLAVTLAVLDGLHCLACLVYALVTGRK
jgi:hypothetical protein